ncbi:DUF222 domain-containing protein [Actinomadura scrupuli]|uniref:HNH endonuclease signature motif containing protein n=1 Tax=Actinomadura scrupuli TaxID=559629 RepID=UPI003D962F9F
MWSMDAGLADASWGELAQACEAIAAELATRPAPEPGLAALEVAETVGRAVDRAEAALAVLVARVDVSGVHGEHGFPSTVSWLRERLGMRHGRAAERVTLARQLPRLERVRKLLSGGGLSFGFASTVCAATPRLDAEDAAVAEDILLGMVEDGCSVGQVAKAGDRITDLIAERLGREVEPEDSKRGFARSWMTRSKSLDGGSWFKGWCNPEHTAALDQIIGPLAKPRAQGDDRDIAQRTADALFSVLTEGNRGAGITLIIDLAAYTAATGDTGPFTHTPRTHTPRTGTASGPPTPRNADNGHAAGSRSAEHDVPQGAAAQSPSAPGRPSRSDTWRDVQGDAVSGDPAQSHTGRDAAESNAARSEGVEWDAAESGAASDVAETGHAAERCAAHDVGVPDERMRRRPGSSPPGALPGALRRPARLLDGTPISPEDARRIALNAGISGLILGHEGIPLYLGRSIRFATSAQRRTLLAQYDTCGIAGCRIPAHLCEIHHLGGGWKLGTPTDIDQLIPLCGWHNRWIETHEDRVDQIRDDQGRTVLEILPPCPNPRSAMKHGPVTRAGMVRHPRKHGATAAEPVNGGSGDRLSGPASGGGGEAGAAA